MVGRGEITDKAWEQIAPLLPDNGRRGGQWQEHCKVVNGILWKLRTGAPWRDLPERYGPWQTCYDRLVRWRRDGTWERLLEHAQTKSDAMGEIEWVVSMDSSVVRAHQHASGARRKPAAQDAKRGWNTSGMRLWATAGEGSPPSCTSLATGRGAPTLGRDQRGTAQREHAA